MPPSQRQPDRFALYLPGGRRLCADRRLSPWPAQAPRGRIGTEVQLLPRAQALRVNLKSASALRIEIIPGESLIGGGSAPTSTLPTFLLAVTAEGLSADEIAARLRGNDPAVIARVEEGRVLIDLRTVFEDEEPALTAALLKIRQ